MAVPPLLWSRLTTEVTKPPVLDFDGNFGALTCMDASIAKAAEACAVSGSVQSAVKMVMDIEDPTHQANRMLSAALLIRNELLAERLD